MRKVCLLIIMFSLIVAVGCGGLPEEVRDMEVTANQGARVDTRGRVQVTVRIRNNSDKTLVSGSYSIYSKDVSGRVLSFDAIYPRDIRPRSSKSATVWMDPRGTLRGEWKRAHFR